MLTCVTAGLVALYISRAGGWSDGPSELPMKREISPVFDIRSALKSRTMTVGSWLQLGSAAAAEILANVGFDWLGIDCEHTSSSIGTVEDICRAVYGRGPAVLVRVSSCDTLEIRKALDVGASGVIVPLVETVEQARQAVAAAKYPPVGVRGYAFTRMNDWGVSFDDYAREANERTSVILMIETKRAVENVDAIAAVEGVDALFIGPYDLSGSYGVPGQLDHPDVQRARLAVLTAARKAGISAGLHLIRASEESFSQTIEEGFTFLCQDADTILLNDAGRKILAGSLSACRLQP